MLPTPTPTKSRSTSGGSSGSDGKERVVAAVCTITTTEMMRLSETRLVSWPAEISGTASAGSVAETAPRTLTPRLSSPNSTTARAGQRKADQCAGNARIDPLATGR